MYRQEVRTDQELIDELDATHIDICVRERHLFSLILEADRRELWKDSGAQSLGAWLSIGTRSPGGRPTGGSVRPMPSSSCLRSPKPSRPASSGWTRWSSSRGWRPLRPRRRSLSGLRRSQEPRSDDRPSSSPANGSLRFVTPSCTGPFRGGTRLRANGSVFLLSVPPRRVRGSSPRSTVSREDPGHAGGRRPCLHRCLQADAVIGILSTRVASHPDPDRATVVVHASAETLMGGGRSTVFGAGHSEPRISGS
jgi:hypothetical protein